MPPLSDICLQVGARASPLSNAQVKEIEDAFHSFYPKAKFEVTYMTTVGDRDHSISLRTLDKTDFFTKDIDEWVLKKEGRIGIHSAKDLPVPLTAGLSLFCLTQGIDSSDSLVLRQEESLKSLKKGAIIATSSFRREEAVKELRRDLSFCDIRGTIEERLAKLEKREVDGVVIAEAALIRLDLMHLNRIRLPGATVEGQGRLAVVGQESDLEIKTLFKCLDSPSNAKK